MPSDPPKDPTKFTQLDWAKDFLARLGAPDTTENEAAVVTWEMSEGGHFVNNATYNPLNTTQDAPGATSINPKGVKAYPDYETGMAAAIKTISSPNYGYPAIISALRNGNSAPAVLSAIGQSSWGTGAALLFKTLPAGQAAIKAGGSANTAGDPANLAGAVTDATPLPGGDNPLSSLTDLVKLIGTAGAWVANRHNWVRILEVVGGALIILVGLAGLTRDTWQPAAKDAAMAAAA